MADFNVLGAEGSFLLSTPLRIKRQRIGSFVCVTLAVIDLKVVTREFLGLADLSGAQTVCVHKPAEVVMVSIYKNFMLKAF